MWSFKRLILLSALLVYVLPLMACELGFPAGQEPYAELNITNMADQQKLKPQRENLFSDRVLSMYTPQPGTVYSTETPYHLAQADAALAKAVRANPLKDTPEVLKNGEWVYTNYCIVCHGPEAAGDGEVTFLFPKPPSLMRQVVRDWDDADIFHRPMRGQNSMPAYANQLEQNEIWAVIRYIRSLQNKLPVAPPTDADKQAAAKKAAEQAAQEAADGEPTAETGDASPDTQPPAAQ